MATMTWGEFKAAVEAKGVHDEDKIDFIDWHADELVHDVSVTREVIGDWRSFCVLN